MGKELGVTYELGFEVDSIENENGLFSVKSKTGEEIKSDVVISNADYNHTEQVLIPAEKRQFDEDSFASSPILARYFSFNLSCKNYPN